MTFLDSLLVVEFAGDFDLSLEYEYDEVVLKLGFDDGFVLVQREVVFCFVTFYPIVFYGIFGRRSDTLYEKVKFNFFGKNINI